MNTELSHREQQCLFLTLTCNMELELGLFCHFMCTLVPGIVFVLIKFSYLTLRSIAFRLFL